jgi:hypothetical protein
MCQANAVGYVSMKITQFSGGMELVDQHGGKQSGKVRPGQFLHPLGRVNN